jgi:FlaA1/EpsC-like NDP-sugar epimerase
MEKIGSYIIDHRRLVVVAIHAGLIALANYCAFLLRFEGAIDPSDLHLFYKALPVLLVIRLSTLTVFKLHEGLWRYAGIWDLSRIIQACVLGTILFATMIRRVIIIDHYPTSIYFLDSILLVVLMGGSRLGRRIYHEFGGLQKGRRVLIIGAGNAGEMIVRDMKNNPYYGHEPVGFVDDDKRKIGTRVHGIPVLGGREDLQRIIEMTVPQEVLIAIPSARPAEIRELLEALQTFKVEIRTLPNLRDLLQGKVTVGQIRELALEDLLERPVVQLDRESLQSFIGGSCVLVTGAAGSIGSELCRQILELNPKVVLACDRHENGLFELQGKLSPKYGHRFVPMIVDVTDSPRVNALMERYRPQIVFHAAAYKHVPMMQVNPSEATKNNVGGTRIVAEAACQVGVSRFILISTDKAVNPTSVMGATKRVAEMLVRMIADTGRCFLSVRFGNVLGSNGSVIPKFLQQIQEGGPITVTHGEMRRFFMLIPEAVQLVMHAAAIAEPGCTYVLQMGQQIKILDMARHLARLAGYLPEIEMPIAITGIRLGEKLQEELIANDEVATPSPIPNVIRVESTASLEAELFTAAIAGLEQLARDGRDGQVLAKLRELVPTAHFEAQELLSETRPPAGTARVGESLLEGCSSLAVEACPSPRVRVQVV